MQITEIQHPKSFYDLRAATVPDNYLPRRPDGLAGDWLKKKVGSATDRSFPNSTTFIAPSHPNYCYVPYAFL